MVWQNVVDVGIKTGNITYDVYRNSCGLSGESRKTVSVYENNNKKMTIRATGDTSSYSGVSCWERYNLNNHFYLDYVTPIKSKIVSNSNGYIFGISSFSLCYTVTPLNCYVGLKLVSVTNVNIDGYIMSVTPKKDGVYCYSETDWSSNKNLFCLDLSDNNAKYIFYSSKLE